MTESSPLELSEETLEIDQWEKDAKLLARLDFIAQKRILSLIQALRRSQEKLKVAQELCEGLWRSHRPVDWNLEAHLASPFVNSSRNEEALIAFVVAEIRAKGE